MGGEEKFVFQRIFDFSDYKEKPRHVERINYNDTRHFILNVHYAQRMPSISYAFGLFVSGQLTGVCTFGSPASHYLCKGICGENFYSEVLELNRLVLLNNKKNEASFLISQSLKLLPKPKIIVSYADTEHEHIGTVYQATNFLFTGTTKERTDIAGDFGKHSRHHNGDLKNRVKRSAKHRYVYFLGNKKEKMLFKSNLNYPVYNYPKKKERMSINGY